ncbi:2,3-epoxybenzoyl-CoA dihydrolase [Nisaea sp.]|uniref:2,3-epoxybenzoyl-CoA dihydrolase n=1 Tax=Nisaea sp. TaxID=2024842 RepID=UPI003B51E915
MTIDFRTDPTRYKHWKLEFDGSRADLVMDVDEQGGLFEGYELKLNSYDLGVDIELYDAIQRLRFEHPEVKVVVLRSAKDRVFCAGANIRMLAGAAHAHKVNFCKFTNETRNYMEEASAESGQKYLAAVTGACAGGGYELALATDHIILTDDGSSSVALPEAPLLAVLPGTGGLTRVTDKRKVRRDRADVFCAIEEGIKGKRAADWDLVDEVAPNSKFDEVVAARVSAMAETSDRPSDATGIALPKIDREIDGELLRYSLVTVEIDREERNATILIKGPEEGVPADTDALAAFGADYWLLKLCRELDDAILHLRLNELEIGTLIFKTEGDGARVLEHDAFLAASKGNWLAREILLYWKRVMKRIDVTSRSLVALVEPGSCFAGSLAELLFACDRSYMLEGQLEGDNRPPAEIALGPANFGPFPMSNGLTRLETRFLGAPEAVKDAEASIGESLDAERAEELGLVTFIFDDIDWEDEVRIFLEERASFSPDALTGMEANLRFAGPETMETKIFGRLTAWQNWIFQRPNAVGPEGALGRYGSGRKPEYDTKRV